MSSVVIVGTQWGDEGKGKVVDLYAEDADAVVRYQGGNNAGHTVVVKGEQTILHLIPSGDPARPQDLRDRQRRCRRPGSSSGGNRRV